MSQLIARNRQRLDRDLASSPRRQYISAVVLGQYRITIPLARKYLRGALIDLGCGMMPYRSFIERQVTRYDSLDARPLMEGVTFQADLQDMNGIPSETYDSAICLEVLEHIPLPFKAAAEIYRILKPGGVLVASVPHLSRLHEEPYDFYRYTHYGFRTLFESAGFEVLEMQRRGGLISFLSHQLSLMLVGLTWSVPVLKHSAFFVNQWLVVRPSYFMDAHFDRSGKFALGYTCVARKPVKV